LTGAIVITYFTQGYYTITWDPISKIWLMEFHPLLMILLFISILFIVYELISFIRLIVIRTRHPKVKKNLRLYFIGWITIGSSGFVFGISMGIPQIPAYLYLIFFTLGIGIISIAIYLLPSSLIATTQKLYNIGFISPDSGLAFLFYDFQTGKALKDSLLFSGALSAIDRCLNEAVRGCRYLKVLDLGPRKILTERGFRTQAILIAEKATPMSMSLLKRLLILFETKYFDTIGRMAKTGINTDYFKEFVNTIEIYMAFAL